MLQVGRKINDRYIIEELLVRGNISSVFLVSDLRTPGNRYVLKEIVENSQKPADRKITEFMFLKEIENLKKLKHPGIADIYDGFIESGRFYVLSQYIDGWNLGKRMNSGEKKLLNHNEVRNYFEKIARTLGYFSSRGEEKPVFRSIKPGDFVINLEGDPILVDLGLSHLFRSSERVSPYSVGFTSPDVLMGKPYDEKADIYATGALIYYLVTGKTPGILPGKLPPASDFNPDLPEPFVNLLRYCLAEPEKRISDVPTLLHSIETTYETIEAREKLADLQMKVQHIKTYERKWNFSLIIVTMVVLAIIALTAAFCWKRYVLYRCEKNCKTITAALGRYADAHGGRYPDKLSKLIPDYLAEIPKCPAAGKDSYSGSYRAYNFPGFHYCKFCCHGTNHSSLKIPENFPRYNPIDGLMLRPTPGYETNPVENLMEAYRLDREGKYAEAIDKFRDLTVMDSVKLRDRGGIEKYMVFWNMARILEKTGQKKEALKKYSVAAKLLLKENIYKFNPDIVFMLIQDLKRLGQYRYALHFYNTLTHKYVLQKENPDPRVVIDMMEIYEKLGRRNDAIRLLRKYYNKAPRNEKLIISAEIYRLEGYPYKAREYYQIYLNRSGEKMLRERAVEFDR